jgi:hypothetical protein
VAKKFQRRAGIGPSRRSRAGRGHDLWTKREKWEKLCLGSLVLALFGVVERPTRPRRNRAGVGPAANRHLELHLERREQKDGRTIHVGDDMLKVASKGFVETCCELLPWRANTGRVEAGEKTYLAKMMLGIDELVEMAEVVQGKLEGTRVRGSVTIVGQERDAAPPIGLKLEQLDWGGHPSEQQGGKTLVPGDESARGCGRNAAEPVLGEKPNERRARSTPEGGTPNALVRPAPLMVFGARENEHACSLDIPKRVALEGAAHARMQAAAPCRLPHFPKSDQRHSAKPLATKCAPA